MKELSSEIHVLLNSAAQNIVLAADEYIDPADGLIHCKSCGGQKTGCNSYSRYCRATSALLRCLCPCLAIAEQRRRETEEQRKRIERIRRRREQGLQDRHLYNIPSPTTMGKIHRWKRPVLTLMAGIRPTLQIPAYFFSGMLAQENPFLPGALPMHSPGQGCFRDDDKLSQPILSRLHGDVSRRAN